MRAFPVLLNRKHFVDYSVDIGHAQVFLSNLLPLGVWCERVRRGGGRRCFEAPAGRMWLGVGQGLC